MVIFQRKCTYSLGGSGQTKPFFGLHLIPCIRLESLTHTCSWDNLTTYGWTQQPKKAKRHQHCLPYVAWHCTDAAEIDFLFWRGTIIDGHGWHLAATSSNHRMPLMQDAKIQQVVELLACGWLGWQEWYRGGFKRRTNLGLGTWWWGLAAWEREHGYVLETILFRAC